MEGTKSDIGLTCISGHVKAISHPLRLKILFALVNKEMSVQDIAQKVGLTSCSNIAQHVAILRNKGILESRKHASRVYYRLVKTEILNEILRFYSNS